MGSKSLSSLDSGFLLGAFAIHFKVSSEDKTWNGHAVRIVGSGRAVAPGVDSSVLSAPANAVTVFVVDSDKARIEVDAPLSRLLVEGETVSRPSLRLLRGRPWPLGRF